MEPQTIKVEPKEETIKIPGDIAPREDNKAKD
jgi:hypothetical protein